MSGNNDLGVGDTRNIAKRLKADGQLIYTSNNTVGINSIAGTSIQNIQQLEVHETSVHHPVYNQSLEDRCSM